MASTRQPDRSAWLAKAGYGIGLHWTAQSLPRGKTKPMPFARAVERFDVARMVQQCVDAGAGWLLFTVSHAVQHLPFPSKTLDRILPGRTCERDLMGELAAGLAAHGIRLILYYPSVATDDDPAWQRASGWLYDPTSYAACQYDLVAEIGERYGTRLAGWWLDNCYDPRLCPFTWHHLHPGVNGFAGLYDFPRYAAALRTGNPARLVTFNFTGTGAWRSTLGNGIVDYAAGESNDLDRVPHGPGSGEGGARWHGYVWMDEAREGGGNGWVHSVPGDVGPPRYSTEHVADYVRYVRQHDGAFTYGAAPYQDDLMAETTLRQLQSLKRHVGASASGQGRR